MDYIRIVLNKYKNLPLPIKASFWFIVCNFFQKGVAFLTTPIYTRILTTEEFGQYSTYMSWNSIIIIFATLNLSSAVYNNCLIKYNTEENKTVTSSFIGLSTTITVAIFFLLTVFNKAWNSASGLGLSLMIAMFIEMLFEPAYQLWTARERFQYRYRNVVILTCIIVLFSQAVSIIAVINLPDKVNARVWSSTTVVALVGLHFYIKSFRESHNFFSKRYWHYALAFNFPLIPHYLSQTVLNQADRIMIAGMVGDSAAGKYSLAYNISSILTVVISSINNSLVPYTYQSLKNNQIARLRNVVKGIQLLILSLCTFIMLLGPEVIHIIGGKKYDEAISVIPPVVSSVFFISLYSLYANIEFYFEKTKSMLSVSLSAAILNIILNYFCIQKWGYIAAGYTTLICYIYFSVVHFILYRRLLSSVNIEKIYDMKETCLFSIINIICAFSTIVLYRFNYGRYILIITVCIFIFIRRKILYEVINTIIRK